MTTLLQDIFNHDFKGLASTADFQRVFFGKTLGPAELMKISKEVRESNVTLHGKTIPAALLIPGKKSGKPYAILAQLHGNEPAGLAGILLTMALSAAGKLEGDVIGIIGNPLAAGQYFEAWSKNPSARQETRDAFRCGLDEKGNLLPDMNRIPIDFRTRTATDHHTKRAQELYAVGEQVWGIVDIHSARGNMLCITDHKRDSDLLNSPIRAVLTELAEAISANASATVTVQTFKTILGPLDSIETQTGIEAGRHEAPDSPHNAASFTLSLLHTLKLTDIAPIYKEENGIFERYSVQPRITYDDLAHAPLAAGDKVYMAKRCASLASVPERSELVIVKQGDHYALQSVAEFTQKPQGSMEYAMYQYDEMEPIAKGEVVAVALPSGVTFSTKESFSGIFVSKSSVLYDKDPAVGPWPVAADKISSIKFCYPCHVSSMKLEF